jgi:hypothetical protein
MQKIQRQVLLAFLLAFLGLPALFGCQSTAAAGLDDPPPLPQARVIDPPSGANMLSANTYAGDAVAGMLLKRMSSGRSIVSTSMVEMDKLEQSSTFGRVAMQQVASRVAQHGFRVVDVRLTEAMIINNNGEFMLSRDVCKVLADRHDAYAALVGVYTPAGSRVYVSVRALRLSDAAVIAAYEYYLPYGGDVASLMSARSGAYVTAGSGEPLWSRYAGRGQAFADCPPGKPAAAQSGKIPPQAAAAPSQVASSANSSAPKAAPRASSPKKSGKKRGAARKGYQAYDPQPQTQGVSYAGNTAEPICPQNVPSNRRAVPDDCKRSAIPYGRQNPLVYGDAYIDRGGGRMIDPNSPPPAVGRAPY